MPRRHLPVGLWALVACGGTDDAALALQIRTEGSGLNPAMVSADIQVHTGVVDCAVILLDRRGVPPTYGAVVNVRSGAAKGDAQINQIRPAAYTVAVWGLDAGERPVAFGCAPVTIETGALAQLSVALIDLPTR
ncbi:MAG: hypothetical protein IPG45_09620 [Deltaproteobacteria bacterium]|nr:hypothetical protein [Deltaproteobacteria bacterium]